MPGAFFFSTPADRNTQKSIVYIKPLSFCIPRLWLLSRFNLGCCEINFFILSCNTDYIWSITNFILLIAYVITLTYEAMCLKELPALVIKMRTRRKKMLELIGEARKVSAHFIHVKFAYHKNCCIQLLRNN